MTKEWSSRSRSIRGSSSNSSRTLHNESLATSKLHIMFKSDLVRMLLGHVQLTTQNMPLNPTIWALQPGTAAVPRLARSWSGGWSFRSANSVWPYKVISKETAVFKMSFLFRPSSTNVSLPLKFMTLDLTVTTYHSHPHPISFHIISYHHHWSTNITNIII